MRPRLRGHAARALQSKLPEAEAKELNAQILLGNVGGAFAATGEPRLSDGEPILKRAVRYNAAAGWPARSGVPSLSARMTGITSVANNLVLRTATSFGMLPYLNTPTN